MPTSRRSFLAVAALTPFALGAAGRAGAAEACYDPAALSLSQKNLRRSLSYVEASADPKRHCGLCEFYTARSAGCGSCKMMSDNPVNSGGLCDSFAPKG